MFNPSPPSHHLPKSYDAQSGPCSCGEPIMCALPLLVWHHGNVALGRCLRLTCGWGRGNAQPPPPLQTDRQYLLYRYIECTVGGNPSACADLSPSPPLPPTTAHPISPPLRLEHDGRLSDLRSPLSAALPRNLKLLGSLVAASSSSSRALLLVLTLAAFGHFHLLRVSRKPIKVHVLPDYTMPYP